jgi:hypothetical protein
MNLPWNSLSQKPSGTGQFFIFQLDYNSKHKCTSAPELLAKSHFSVVFGTDDIVIHHQSNRKSNSYCNLGNCYELGKGVDEDRKGEYLAGEISFSTLQIEVYLVRESNIINQLSYFYQLLFYKICEI